MTWIATAQIVLPQLPVTEFEQSGRLNGARRFMKRAALLGPWYPSINVALIFLFPWLAALRDYRSWKLEQLALATSYLLGPNEAMLAGETSLLDSKPLMAVPRRRTWLSQSRRPTSWSLALILSMGNRDRSSWQVVRPTLK
jgi:hypothetical protein